MSKTYDFKYQFKTANRLIGQAYSRIHRNSVMSPEGHPGAKYVPWSAVQSLLSALRYTKRLATERRKQAIQIHDQIISGYYWNTDTNTEQEITYSLHDAMNGKIPGVRYKEIIQAILKQCGSDQEAV